MVGVRHPSGLRQHETGALDVIARGERGTKDDTPRSGTRGLIFEGSTPELFQNYVSKAVELVRDRPRDKRLVFLKAWNEWAEGNYVEPDSNFGHRYLDAMRRALNEDGR
jgi:Glycosyltransferase WbsX